MYKLPSLKYLGFPQGFAGVLPGGGGGVSLRFRWGPSSAKWFSFSLGSAAATPGFRWFASDALAKPKGHPTDSRKSILLQRFYFSF